MIWQKHKSFEKIILFTFMLLPTLAISLNLDNDFWFLLNHGKYILENGFPIVEPFTIHNDFSFIIQQWLFDVIVCFLYTYFGKVGVMALIYITALFVVYFIYKLCMLMSNNSFYLSVLLTTYSYLLLCMWFMVSRPQIITYMLLLIELLSLETYIRNEKWYYLVPLPLVSLALINCHASMWWLSFAFLLPYVIETVRIKWFGLNPISLKKMPIYVTTGLMLIMGLVNPYGYKAISYIFTSFGNDDINYSILEMAVPDVKTLNGAIYYITIAFIVSCYLLNRKGQIKLRYILLALGTCLLSLMSIKSIPYLLIGAFIPLSYNLKNIGDKLVFKENSKHIVSLISVFIVLIYLASFFVIVRDYDASKDFPETKDAIEYLKENTNEKSVCLYTGFFDGGYAEYKGFKTYIDARAEVFLESNNKQKDVFSEYISLQNGSIHYQEFLSTYSFTHILVTKTDVLNVYLSSDDDYTIFYEDDKSKIFMHRNS